MTRQLGGLLQSFFPVVDKATAPSVTTILGVIAKPALIDWASRTERTMVATIAARLYATLYEVVDEPLTPKQFYDMVVEEAGKPAGRKLMGRAASIGTEVHARIEWEFKGELHHKRDPEPPPLTTPKAQRSFQRWLEWRQSVQLEVVSTEQWLFSYLFGFAGTMDLLAWITVDGVRILVVIDFKTGKRVYGEAFLQNIAYRLALIEDGIEAMGGIIVRLPKQEDDPEFEAVTVPPMEPLIPVFLSALVLYRWWEEDKHGKLHKDEHGDAGAHGGGPGAIDPIQSPIHGPGDGDVGEGPVTG